MQWQGPIVLCHGVLLPNSCAAVAQSPQTGSTNAYPAHLVYLQSGAHFLVRAGGQVATNARGEWSCTCRVQAQSGVAMFKGREAAARSIQQKWLSLRPIRSSVLLLLSSASLQIYTGKSMQSRQSRPHLLRLHLPLMKCSRSCFNA